MFFFTAIFSATPLFPFHFSVHRHGPARISPPAGNTVESGFREDVQFPDFPLSAPVHSNLSD